MNPYALLGVGILWIASLIGVGYWQHGAGEDAQKVADQKQFDGINAKLTQQKADANAQYRAAQADIIALQGQRDEFKNQLTRQKLDYDKKTLDLHAHYADRGLRYASQNSGRGCSGESTGGTKTDAASNAAPTTVELQLPDGITKRLRQLTLYADQVADDYRLCYAYATTVK